MKEYTYSVARVRAKEASLLTSRDIEQLIASDSYESALRFLRDRGYSGGGADDAEDIVAAAEKETLDFISEIADGALLNIIRLPVDYHNIKASVKSVFSGIDGTDLLLDGGTADKNVIYESVRNRSYSELDQTLARVAEEAMALLLRTQDGQACAIYTDNEMFKAIEAEAKKSGDAFLKRCAAILADTANLKAAYRSAAAGKNLPFIKTALYSGGTLNVPALAQAAENGVDALCEHVAATDYADGAEYMKAGAHLFEKWCDDEVMKLTDGARYESFSPAPIIAYYLAKKAETGTVRLILEGKRSRLGDDMIRERVRRTYV